MQCGLSISSNVLFKEFRILKLFDSIELKTAMLMYKANKKMLRTEVLLPKTRPILTGICYRPPRQSDFFDILELSINGGHCLNECILLGDFNTDILLPTNNVLVNALRNFEHAFGLKQLIVEPTRVCINKASAIDLMLVSDPEKVCQSGVLCVGMSDHLLT